MHVTIRVCSRRAASAKPSASPSTTISPSAFGAGLPTTVQQPPDAPRVRLGIFAPSFMRGRPSESRGISWTACTSGMPGHAATHADGGASNVTRAGPWGSQGALPSSG